MPELKVSTVVWVLQWLFQAYYIPSYMHVNVRMSKQMSRREAVHTLAGILNNARSIESLQPATVTRLGIYNSQRIKM